MMNKVKIYQSERLDLPDLQNMLDFTEAELQEWAKSVFAGIPLSGTPTSYVLQGFTPTAISNLSLEVVVANAVLFNTAVATGTLSGATYRGESTTANLPITLADDADNYVHVVVSRASGEADLRVFWDKVANSGDGAEWSQVVNTVDALSISLYSSVVGWSTDADKIPIFKAVTAGGAITSLTDYRNLFFRLGKPDDPMFTNYLTSRIEPNPDIISDPLAFTGADKEITSLKTWMDTVMTAIKEIKWGTGPNKWYQRASTHLDSTSDVLTDGGTWTWYVADPDAGGPLLANSLYFSSDATILLDGGIYYNTIQSSESPLTLLDGELAYVALNRNASVDVVPVVVAASAYISDPDNLIIVRRIGTKVYIGNTPLVLDDTDTGTLSVTADIALYNYVGALGFAPAMPDYTSLIPTVTTIVDGESLTMSAARLSSKIDDDVVNQLPPIGTIVAWYNYGLGGAAPVILNTAYWKYCDGTAIVGGPLDGIDPFTGVDRVAPDLANRYLVGFGTDGAGNVGTAAWVTAVVGAGAGHVVNLQHTHTTDIGHVHANTITATVPGHRHGCGTLAVGGGSHDHTLSDFGYKLNVPQGGSGTSTAPVHDNTNGGWVSANHTSSTVHAHSVSGQIGFGAGPSGDGAFGCSMGGSVTAYAGSPTSSTPVASMAATSIQPRSIRVRWIMRIL